MVTLGRFLLHSGELLRLDLGGRISLHCGSGRLLVTASSDRSDHELQCGERLDCGGLVLVEGAGELRVDRLRKLHWPFGRECIELISTHYGEHHV
jgi:hypothetical protein